VSWHAQAGYKFVDRHEFSFCSMVLDLSLGLLKLMYEAESLQSRIVINQQTKQRLQDSPVACMIN
jgi:hypothetical protein